jgi:hypothetical protein
MQGTQRISRRLGSRHCDASQVTNVPQRWVAMMRRSLLTNGPRFSATPHAA